jgi:imidazolonepropionase-like amidohydrolase
MEVRAAGAHALAAACIALALAAPALAETIALVGGTVHPVTGPDIGNATVVIRDGKIAAVGADVTPPADATIVSCVGKHVYPGFITANSVIGLTEISSVRATNDDSEIGTFNPNIRAEVQINPESDLIPVARAGGITSAVVMPRGGAISGTAALVHLSGWTYEDMTVQAPLGLYVQWPGMTATTDEQKKARDKQVREIRDAFEEARAYWKARDAEGKSGIPRHDRDVKWDAMGRALRGEIPVIFRAAGLNQLHAVLGFVDEMKLQRVVLLDGWDAWRIPDEIKSRNISVITTDALDDPARRDEPYDTRFALPGRLHAAGIPFAIADDGSRSSASLARNLPQHAATAAAFGLPREEALKSVTLYPARIFGVDDRLGSIEVGKIADVFVADGDPLEITTRIEAVWIAGKPVSMETRHTRLFQKYDGKPRGEKARPRDAAAAGGSGGR